jgi:hypothetical protein
MADHRLLKTDKNYVLQMIRERGLDPADFTWSDMAPYGHQCSGITHLPTGYYFGFLASDAMGVTYVLAGWTPPDGGGRTEAQVHTRTKQFEKCYQWLRVVKAEYEAPDLWADLQSESAFLRADVPADEDRPFTENERGRLLEGLNAIRSHLITASAADPAQTTQINVAFTYVAEGSKRLSKRDWKNLFAGSLFTLLVTIGTDHAVIRSTLKLAVEYVLPLLKALPRLPLS